MPSFWLHRGWCIDGVFGRLDLAALSPFATPLEHLFDCVSTSDPLSQEVAKTNNRQYTHGNCTRATAIVSWHACCPCSLSGYHSRMKEYRHVEVKRLVKLGSSVTPASPTHSECRPTQAVVTLVRSPRGSGDDWTVTSLNRRCATGQGARFRSRFPT